MPAQAVKLQRVRQQCASRPVTGLLQQHALQGAAHSDAADSSWLTTHRPKALSKEHIAVAAVRTSVMAPLWNLTTTSCGSSPLPAATAENTSCAEQHPMSALGSPWAAPSSELIARGQGLSCCKLLKQTSPHTKGGGATGGWNPSWLASAQSTRTRSSSPGDMADKLSGSRPDVTAEKSRMIHHISTSWHDIRTPNMPSRLPCALKTRWAVFISWPRPALPTLWWEVRQFVSSTPTSRLPYSAYSPATHDSSSLLIPRDAFPILGLKFCTSLFDKRTPRLWTRCSGH